MTLRLIHVGLGGWGRNWATDVVARNPKVKTVAWVEIVEEVLQQAQKSLNLPVERCFTSLEQALASVEADAVLITANLPGHVPSALTALQADKHVLLEKPFAPTIAEAQQLVDLAEQRNRILMISQNYRFMPAVQLAVEVVQRQVLGSVGTVHIDFRRYANTAPVATNRHYHIWHPLLVDMSIHHFDMMRYVLEQEPIEIACHAWNPTWSNFDEPAAATATITFDGGTVVTYRGSWVSPTPFTNWGGEWVMECEKGDILWTSRGELGELLKVRERDGVAKALEIAPLDHTDRSGSLTAFVKAVETGVQPSCNGRDNLQTLALMFAAVESADSGGRPVKIAKIS